MDGQNEGTSKGIPLQRIFPAEGGSEEAGEGYRNFQPGAAVCPAAGLSFLTKNRFRRFPLDFTAATR